MILPEYGYVSSLLFLVYLIYDIYVYVLLKNKIATTTACLFCVIDKIPFKAADEIIKKCKCICVCL